MTELDYMGIESEKLKNVQFQLSQLIVKSHIKNKSSKIFRKMNNSEKHV